VFPRLHALTQGHSRSFILQSITGRQGVWRHCLHIAM